MTISAKERQRLNTLLTKANGQRAALDETLGWIEGIVGEVDNLDELVGNGIDADGLLAAIEEEEEDEKDA